MDDSPTTDGGFEWYYPDNFNAYDIARVESEAEPAVQLSYGPRTDDVDDPQTLDDLDTLLRRDRQEKVAGDRGIVLHDVAEFGEFSKIISLDGRTVHVTYRATKPGHLVANEFCVDLWASAMKGCRQATTVTGRTATVTNDQGLAVSVTLGEGCAFAANRPPAQDATKTLHSPFPHRVMTDTIAIVCAKGGDFDYAIKLP